MIEIGQDVTSRAEDVGMTKKAFEKYKNAYNAFADGVREANGSIEETDAVLTTFLDYIN